MTHPGQNFCRTQPPGSKISRRTLSAERPSWRAPYTNGLNASLSELSLAPKPGFLATLTDLAGSIRRSQPPMESLFHLANAALPAAEAAPDPTVKCRRPSGGSFGSSRPWEPKRSGGTSHCCGRAAESSHTRPAAWLKRPFAGRIEDNGAG